jgi:tetratricopeptide (TPR) repeat protein
MQVLDRFLRALGLPPDGLPPDLEEQAARYRGLLAGRRALVVLDNASSAEQVRPLLPASASCLVLVTSRDRLAGLIAAEGAKVLMLDVLAPSEALELLSRTAGPGRVSREPDAAADVVQLCGCLPLAVRIAGARLAIRPTMGMAELAGLLSDERARLGELSAGDVGVRASFALSYEALDPDAARMFRRLGLIPGPDFARGVAGVLVETTVEEAEKLIEALVDAHLVEPAPILGRYRFHDLLRLYARERAQVEEGVPDRQAAVLRMLEWYLDMADAADRRLSPGRRRLPYERTGRGQEDPALSSLGQALTWFEAERASHLAANHEAADQGIHFIAWQIPDALRVFFSLRSYWVDWRDTHRIGLVAARETGNRHAEAWIMTSLGHMFRELNRFDEAMAVRRRSLAMFRELRKPEGEARVLNGLGAEYLELSRLNDAIPCGQEALALCQKIGYPYGEGQALGLLGKAYLGLGRFEEATDCLHQSLAIRRQLGDRWGEGSTLRNLGRVYSGLGRFEEAIDCEQQALAVAREVGHRWGEGRALELFGRALQHTQGIKAARPCWEEALAIFTELGAPRAEEVRALLEDSSGTLDSNT